MPEISHEDEREQQHGSADNSQTGRGLDLLANCGFDVVEQTGWSDPAGNFVDGAGKLVSRLLDLGTNDLLVTLVCHSLPLALEPIRTTPECNAAGEVPASVATRSLCAGAPDRYGRRMTATTRLSPGDTAPEFTLPDADGNPVSLSNYKGKRVIVYFYPAASTPGCTKQACDFRDSLSRLTSEGFVVLGISPDNQAKLQKFRDKESLTFPLLSDVDKTVLGAYGAYGEKKMYGKTVTGVIRSTFVIAADGTVELAQYGVRATGHVAKLRRDLGLD
jgi:thioredoxin-dependent peroxiredoxin